MNGLRPISRPTDDQESTFNRKVIEAINEMGLYEVAHFQLSCIRDSRSISPYEAIKHHSDHSGVVAMAFNEETGEVKLTDRAINAAAVHFIYSTVDMYAYLDEYPDRPVSEDELEEAGL